MLSKTATHPILFREVQDQAGLANGDRAREGGDLQGWEVQGLMGAEKAAGVLVLSWLRFRG